LKLIKQLIWLYFFLLIFEGALRKWFLPGFSDVLLVVRDPLLLLIYLQAFTRNRFPLNNVVAGMFILGVISVMLAMTVGHGNPIVAAFGFRTNFLAVPLVFLMPKIFDRSDVLKFAKVTLWITLGMTPLIALQFLQPQSAWVNRGVGGSLEGAGFDGADGRYRPPGTFSFITGLSMFYTLATAMLLSLLTEKRIRVSKPILAAVGVAILLAIPLSISRSLALSAALVVAGGTGFMILGGFQMGRIFKVALFFAMAAIAVQFLPVFDDATSAFNSRWEAATTDRGGFEATIVARVLDNVFGPFLSALDQPIFGMGIGAGTNVGARFLTGRVAFLAGEGELFRLMGEFGMILGLVYIALRWSVLAVMLQTSLHAARKRNFVPGMLFSAGGLWMFYGQWGPPTLQGFSIFTAGLCLAGARIPRDPKKGRSANRKKRRDKPKIEDEVESTERRR